MNGYGMNGDDGSTAFGPFEIRWREYGPSGAPHITLIHGIYAGAHGYEWRRLVPELAESHRVRVIDLLGAGRSDRPELDYSSGVLRSEFSALLDDIPDGSLVVASSLSGAYVVDALDRLSAEQRVSVLAITPTGLGDGREEPRLKGHGRRFLYDVVRRTPLGDVLVYALTSEKSVAWFQRNKTYANPDEFDEDEGEATRRAGRLPGAKFLQLSFVFDRLSIDLDPEVIERSRPTVIWATGQDFTDDAEASRWEDAGATVLRTSAGLPQVEDPESVVAAIEQVEESTRVRALS